MSTVFAMVSTEQVEQEGPDPVAEAPAADALEPRDMEEEDSASSEDQAEDDGPPSEEVLTELSDDYFLGLTWVPKRGAWILRYEDDRGKKRQKPFAAAECTRAGQAEASRWLEEYNEGRVEVLDV